MSPRSTRQNREVPSGNHPPGSPFAPAPLPIPTQSTPAAPAGPRAPKKRPETRDAAIGFALAAPQNAPTQSRRDTRNRRDKKRRAARKARGEASNRSTVADIRIVLATAADPGTYQLADRLPTGPEAGRPGCPRDYPNWVYIIISAGVRAWGSVTKTITNFRETTIWEAILDEVRAHRGDDAVDSMRRK